MADNFLNVRWSSPDMIKLLVPYAMVDEFSSGANGTPKKRRLFEQGALSLGACTP